MITALAPAKINLSLEIMGRRPDGFHDLVSVVQAVSLADAVSVRSSDSLSLRCVDPELKCNNLAIRAATMLADRFSISAGATINLCKHIPVAAGLGGGSSDAAATLTALTRLWKLGAGCRELVPLAAELGSDVAFFLHGGIAMISGRGDVVTSLPVTGSAWYVLVNPGFPVSTAHIYEQLSPDDWTNGEATHRVESQIRNTGMPSLGVNGLQATLFRLYPAARECFQAVSAVSNGRALVSGSGPTVVARFDTAGEAETAARTLGSAAPWTAVVRGIARSGWEVPCA